MNFSSYSLTEANASKQRKVNHMFFKKPSSLVLLMIAFLAAGSLQAQNHVLSITATDLSAVNFYFDHDTQTNEIRFSRNGAGTMIAGGGTNYPNPTDPAATGDYELTSFAFSWPAQATDGGTGETFDVAPRIESVVTECRRAALLVQSNPDKYRMKFFLNKVQGFPSPAINVLVQRYTSILGALGIF